MQLELHFDCFPKRNKLMIKLNKNTIYPLFVCVEHSPSLRDKNKD